MNFFSHHIRSLFHQDHRDPHTEFTRHRDNGDSEELHGADGFWQTERKNSLSSPSWRIADQEA